MAASVPADAHASELASLGEEPSKPLRRLQMAIPFMVDMVTKTKTYTAFSIGAETMTSAGLPAAVKPEPSPEPVSQSPAQRKRGLRKSPVPRFHRTTPSEEQSSFGFGGYDAGQHSPQPQEISRKYSHTKSTENYTNYADPIDNKNQRSTKLNKIFQNTDDSLKKTARKPNSEQLNETKRVKVSVFRSRKQQPARQQLSGAKKNRKQGTPKRTVVEAKPLSNENEHNLQRSQKVIFNTDPVESELPMPLPLEAINDNLTQQESEDDEKVLDSCQAILKKLLEKRQSEQNNIAVGDTYRNSDFRSRAYYHSRRKTIQLNEGETTTIRDLKSLGLLRIDQSRETENEDSAATPLNHLSNVPSRKTLLPTVKSLRFGGSTSRKRIKEREEGTKTELEELSQLQDAVAEESDVGTLRAGAQPGSFSFLRRISFDFSLLNSSSCLTYRNENTKLPPNPIYAVLNKLRKHIDNTRRLNEQENSQPHPIDNRALRTNRNLASGHPNQRQEELNNCDKLNESAIRNLQKRATERLEFFQAESRFLMLLHQLPVQASLLSQH